MDSNYVSDMNQLFLGMMPEFLLLPIILKMVSKLKLNKPKDVLNIMKYMLVCMFLHSRGKVLLVKEVRLNDGEKNDYKVRIY